MDQKRNNFRTLLLFLISGTGVFFILSIIVNFHMIADINKPLPPILSFIPKRTHPRQTREHSAFEKVHKVQLNAEGGRQDGIYRQYYATGRLFTETPYTEGRREGLAKTYFKTGFVKQETEWRQGKPDGIQREYYPNRKLKYQAFFKNGLREGMEITYYQDGRIMLEQEYENGQRLSTRRYDINGNLLSEKQYEPNLQDPEP